MPQGMQVRNAANTLVLDTSTKVLKNQTTILFTASNTATQSVSVSTANTSFVSAVAGVAGASGNSSNIGIDVAGSTVNYRARAADGNQYTLRIVQF